MRLNKFLAESLGLSRREADAAIASGKVKIDGTVVGLGAQVLPGMEVSYDNKPVTKKSEFTYVLLNKPAGYVSSRRQQGDTPTLYSLLPKELQSLKTVGRLDKNSSGLILLTDDGDFTFQMTHPKFFKVKRYIVTLDRPLEPLHQQMIADFGITLPDGISQLGLTRLSDDRKKFEVTMHEGRNRQIRRTFAAVGYEVMELHRISFGPYELGDLEEGKWQYTARA